MSFAEQAAYERGVAAGEITQRLAGHDEHLRHINGSIDQMAASVELLAKELRAARSDQAVRDAQVMALAQRTRDTWTRRERWIGVGLFLVAVLGLILTILFH